MIMQGIVKGTAMGGPTTRGRQGFSIPLYEVAALTGGIAAEAANMGKSGADPSPSEEVIS